MLEASAVLLVTGFALAATVDDWWGVRHHFGRAAAISTTLASPAACLVAGTATFRLNQWQTKPLASVSSRAPFGIALYWCGRACSAPLLGWMLGIGGGWVISIVTAPNLGGNLLFQLGAATAWILTGCTVGYAGVRTLRHPATPLVLAFAWYALPFIAVDWISQQFTGLQNIDQVLIDGGGWTSTLVTTDDLLILQLFFSLGLALAVLSTLGRRPWVAVFAATLGVSAAFTAASVEGPRVNSEYAQPVCSSTATVRVCVPIIFSGQLPQIAEMIDQTAAAVPLPWKVDLYAEHASDLHGVALPEDPAVVYFSFESRDLEVFPTQLIEVMIGQFLDYWNLRDCHPLALEDFESSGPEVENATDPAEWIAPPLTVSGEILLWLDTAYRDSGYYLNMGISGSSSSGLAKQLAVATASSRTEWFEMHQNALSTCPSSLPGP